MVKIARKRRGVSPMIVVRRLGMAGTVLGVMILLVTSIQRIGSLIDENDLSTFIEANSELKSKRAVDKVSYKTPLAYGTKGLKEKTAQLVEEAISNGFRHLVTCGHHINHNETGAGLGWKASGVPRDELFLQTCFVPFQSKEFKAEELDPQPIPKTIEEQVQVSIQASLRNLQTNYIDAVVFHNFRAKLWDENEIHRAWKVLEDYVQKGVVRKLGIVSVHDAQWFETFYNTTSIKPSIVQNRFHSNRQYDIPMQETFQKHDIWVQRFWLLTGSSGYGKKNQDMAQQKNVTPAQLLLAFVMSMGKQTCLVGTTSLQHMTDDVDVAKCYPSLFDNDQERTEYAKKLGMRQQQLPGKIGLDFANDSSPKCNAPAAQVPPTRTRKA